MSSIVYSGTKVQNKHWTVYLDRKGKVCAVDEEDYAFSFFDRRILKELNIDRVLGSVAAKQKEDAIQYGKEVLL